MSNQNNQNAINTLTNIVADFTAMISTRMPDDVVDKLKQLREGETSPMGKIIYHTMFDNMQKATGTSSLITMTRKSKSTWQAAAVRCRDAQKC